MYLRDCYCCKCKTVLNILLYKSTDGVLLRMIVKVI